MPPMRFFTACVRKGRLTLDESTDLPEGTLLELVSTEDVLNNGGDLLDAEERAELARELEAADAEVEAGETIDAAEALAELRANGSSRRTRPRPTSRTCPCETRGPRVLNPTLPPWNHEVDVNAFATWLAASTKAHRP